MNLADPAAKMGKSAGSGTGRIGLLDPPEVVRRTIARAVTDTVGRVRRDPVHQPGVTNLLEILLADGRDRVRPTAQATVRRARRAIGLMD